MKKRTWIGIAAVAGIALVAAISYNIFSSSVPAPQVAAKVPTVTLTKAPTQAQGTGEVVLVDDGGISERINAAFESIKTIQAQGQAVNEEIAKLKSDVAALKTRTYKLDTKKLSDLSAKPSAQVAPDKPAAQKETPATPTVSIEKVPAETVKQEAPAEPAAPQQESAPASLTPPPYINGGQKLGEWDALSKDERTKLAVTLCNISQTDAQRLYAPLSYDKVIAQFVSECGVEAPAPKETQVARNEIRARVNINPMSGGRPNGREWSSEDDSQLNEMLARKAIKVFGEPMHRKHDFRGSSEAFQPVPKGCKEQRVKVSGGTMVRVVCD